MFFVISCTAICENCVIYSEFVFSSESSSALFGLFQYLVSLILLFLFCGGGFVFVLSYTSYFVVPALVTLS